MCCCCPGIIFYLSRSSSAYTCIANSTTLSSNLNSPTTVNTLTDTNCSTAVVCGGGFMGGVLSLFSTAPAVATSTKPLQNFNHKITNTSVNNNNNNSSAATTITTSDVSSSSNVSQMRRQPAQQQNIHISKNQLQKQQHQQQHHRRHQSLTSYMLFNGFHMYAFSISI